MFMNLQDIKPDISQLNIITSSSPSYGQNQVNHASLMLYLYIDL